MLKKIKKRNGKIVLFNSEKIKTAVFLALKADGLLEQEAKEGAQQITSEVVGRLGVVFNTTTTPTVEQTQDIVEDVMMRLEFHSAAKMYIKYRQMHKQLRERSELENGLVQDVVRTVKDYTRGDDWEVQENANTGSIVFQGLNAHLAGKALKTYALSEMYGKEDIEIRKLHEQKAIHIHDLSFPLIAYCCGHSIEQLIRRGFGEVSERVQSKPAKHLITIVAQIVNYIGTMQGEFAGAQAFSSVDTFLAPFVRADDLTQKEVDQCMQMLIYGLNVPSRWGWQAPFSNLTFDLTVPRDLKDKKAIIKSAMETGAIVTCENHNIYGGLGSAVAEVLVEEVCVPMLRIGIKDVFSECGTNKELMEKFQISSNHIVEAVKKVIQRKK